MKMGSVPMVSQYEAIDSSLRRKSARMPAALLLRADRLIDELPLDDRIGDRVQPLPLLGFQDQPAERRPPQGTARGSTSPALGDCSST